MADLQGRVLIIDNDSSTRAECRQVLESNSFNVTTAKNGNQALDKIQKESYDVVLLNLNVTGLTGMEVLKRLKELSPVTAVIVITEQAAVASAVEAIKQGAFDYLPRPFPPEALITRTKRAMNTVVRALENACIGQELDRKMLSQVLIGRSEAMNRVVRFIKNAAQVDSTVLVTGETGSGKEVVARTIHKLSRRANSPFVIVDCRPLVNNRFERELFGHLRGAFPGALEDNTGKIELAEGGTLLLDEIAGISLQMQEKLLRTIQERTFSPVGSSDKKTLDVRIMSATTRDLQQEVQDGKFREDLYYKLNAIRISVPPLRERIEDIHALADYYLKKLVFEKSRPAAVISDEVIRHFKRCEWPGNVRELIQALEYAFVNCEGNTIGLKDLPYGGAMYSGPDASPGGSLARLEQMEILNALEQFHGNKTTAADYLGINRKTLREKMQKYGIN